VLRTFGFVAFAAMFAALRSDVLDRERHPTVLLPTGLLLMVWVAAATAYAGHAGSGENQVVALLSTTAHIVAMATWLGGLVALVFLAVRCRDETDSHAAALRRFSPVALGCVAVVLASGVALTWRQVGSLDALTDTTYGSVLIAKVAAFALAVLVAGIVRRQVRGAGLGHPWLLGVEVGFAVVAMSLASVLSATVPARDAFLAPESVRLELSETRYADFVIDPAVSGQPVIMHVYVYGRSGGLQEVESVSVSASSSNGAISGLEIELPIVATGHGETRTAVVPFGGDWTFTISVRVDRFLVETVEHTTTVR
jgi:copper transport protein